MGQQSHGEPLSSICNLLVGHPGQEQKDQGKEHVNQLWFFLFLFLFLFLSQWRVVGLKELKERAVPSSGEE
jgi:hypothetical protein